MFSAALSLDELTSGVGASLKGGHDDRGPVGHQRSRIAVSIGTRVLHCLHPDGSISLAHESKLAERPVQLLHTRSRKQSPFERLTSFRFLRHSAMKGAQIQELGKFAFQIHQVLPASPLGH